MEHPVRRQHSSCETISLLVQVHLEKKCSLAIVDIEFEFIKTYVRHNAKQKFDMCLQCPSILLSTGKSQKQDMGSDCVGSWSLLIFLLFWNLPGLYWQKFIFYQQKQSNTSTCPGINRWLFTEYDVARNSQVLHWTFSIPRATSYSVNNHRFIFK